MKESTLYVDLLCQGAYSETEIIQMWPVALFFFFPLLGRDQGGDKDEREPRG